MPIDDDIRRFRGGVLRRERMAANQLVRQYGQVWQRIQERLGQLDDEYQAAKARGEEPSAAWIYEHNRLQAMKDQVERELNKFADHAEQTVRGQQQEAIESAGKDAEALTRRLAGKAGLTIDWNQIDKQSVEAILGAVQEGTPLHKLFDGFGTDAAQRAGDVLVQGMLLGKNPRAIAPNLRRELAVSLSRALRIARTETLRAHRLATQANYQANSDVVKGWIWHADLSTRTCGECWAMHGTRHTSDEILDDHPNGRCAMVPIVPGYDLKVQPGAEAFAELPADEQMKVLGPAKWNAWKDGKITFDENPTGIVGRRYDPDWGWMRYERSMAEMGLNAADYYNRPQKLGIFGMSNDEVVELGKGIDSQLDNLVGGRQKWSGKILIGDERRMPGMWGSKEFNCDIWLRNDCGPGTLVHELLHGRSPGLAEIAYRHNKGLEEGVIEKLTRMYGADILRENNLSLGARSSYDYYIASLEKARKRVGKDEQGFYLDLYKTKLPDRKKLLREWAEDADWMIEILKELHIR